MTSVGTVLVTGAAGFIGRHLVRALTERGMRVVGLARRVPSPLELPAGIELLCADLSDADALARVLDGRQFDTVVHCAARLPSQSSAAELFATNVGGTASLVAQALRPRGHFLLLSSGLVYGEQAGARTETSACHPLEAYGQSKLAAEAVATGACLALSAELTVLRGSVIYGEGAPAHMLLSALARSLRAGQPFAMTGGAQKRDFLHVEDAVRAICAVLEQRTPGVFNLASDESVTVLQAAETLAALAGTPQLLCPGALPYRDREVFDYRLDASALRRAIGFGPGIDLRAGLGRLWESTT